MRQRNDVCRNTKRGALNPRHARLPSLTLQDRADSAVVHLTTTPRLVPFHPSPRVKSHQGVLVRPPRTSRILQLADLDVKCPRAQTAESEPATNYGGQFTAAARGLCAALRGVAGGSFKAGAEASAWCLRRAGKSNA